jgi:hypothetical protein
VPAPKRLDTARRRLHGIIERTRNIEEPDNPLEMITMAERRFPVRVRIAVPAGGFGQRYSQITDWLDGNCGSDGWAMTPSAMRGCSMTPCRSTLRMRRSPAPSSRAGAPGQRSRRPEVCSECARMNRRHGSGRGCIGHLEVQLPRAPIVAAAPIPATRASAPRGCWDRPC